MTLLYAFIILLGVGSILQTLADQYAIEASEGDMLPAKWVCWGTVVGSRGERWPFFFFKIPSYEWCEAIGPHPAGLKQRAYLFFLDRWRGVYVA